MDDCADWVTLRAAVHEARCAGWTSVSMPLQRILDLARASRVAVVPTRPGSSPIGRLVAARTSSFRSLTNEHGLDEFPLHTDGAHLERPPDVVCLAAANTECATVATRLLRLRDVATSSNFSLALEHAVFRLRGIRQNAYLLAGRGGGIRYDPGCMLPLTADARYVVTALAESSELAHRWHWNPAALDTLVIDNRRVLHGRDAAVRPGRTLERLMLRWGD